MSEKSPLGIELAKVDSEDLPVVEALSGWLIRCKGEQCGAVTFVEGTAGKVARDKAIEDHKTSHREHNDRVKSILENYNAAVIGKPNCPVCTAEIGENHAASCDVAICLVSGSKRAMCPQWKVRDDYPLHLCGEDKWMGQHPGEREANYYGVTLNDLYTHGTWNAEMVRWVIPSLEEGAVRYFSATGQDNPDSPGGYYVRHERKWVSITDEDLAEYRKAGGNVYGEE